MSERRVVPNKCFRTRIEIEGRAYRVVSFFHEHPSLVSEGDWAVFEHGVDKLIVDKLTLAVMAECECEFLTRQVDEDSDEPTIVSVELTTNNKYKAVV
jgi:hypothetical protein